MPNSSAPLARKLQLKTGMRGVILGAPTGFALDAPSGTKLATKAMGEAYDWGLAFAKDSKALAKVAPALVARMREDSMAWLAWPKKSSSIETDLSRDGEWDALWDTGWEGVALVSLDDDWSAWRLRPSKKVKRNERATKAIAERDAGREAVAAYLAKLPAAQRKALEGLRKQILAAAPAATQKISYGMPTFVRNGKNLVHMAAFKDHCSFFPGSVLGDEFRDALRGYTLAKGTIQFTPEKPIPAAIVKRIVRARIAQQDGAATKRAPPFAAQVERAIKRVWPKAKPSRVWGNVPGWAAPRPPHAVAGKKFGRLDPGFVYVGVAERKSGPTIYYVDPGNLRALESSRDVLEGAGARLGRGCIYLRAGATAPSAALETLFRRTKQRDEGA